MNRQTKLATSLSIAVVIVVLIASASMTPVSGNYASKIQCTESALVVYDNPLVRNSSISYSTVTTTVVASYTTTINTSAKVGQTTTIAGSAGQSILARLPSNLTLISISNAQFESCTFIR